MPGVWFWRYLMEMVSMDTAGVDDVRRELAVVIEVCVEPRFADFLDVPPDVRL
jgi:hypothetical protein